MSCPSRSKDYTFTFRQIRKAYNHADTLFQAILDAAVERLERLRVNTMYKPLQNLMFLRTSPRSPIRERPPGATCPSNRLTTGSDLCEDCFRLLIMISAADGKTIVLPTPVSSGSQHCVWNFIPLGFDELRQRTHGMKARSYWPSPVC